MHDCHKVLHQFLMWTKFSFAEYGYFAAIQVAEPLNKIKAEPTQPIFMPDHYLRNLALGYSLH